MLPQLLIWEFFSMFSKYYIIYKKESEVVYMNKKMIVTMLLCILESIIVIAISPNYQSAPKDAGFHVVQASLLLTRHLPLKEALVLLTTIPKGILIFFYTQFI